MIQKSERDFIIDEIHRTRREFAAKFDGDIVAMLDDARMRQAASGRPVWRAKAKEASLDAGDRGSLPEACEP